MQSGKDGYQFYTGLLRKVQRVIDGLDSNPTEFQGVRAGGIQVQVAAPTVRNVSLALDVTLSGVTIGVVANNIKAKVSSYINGLDIGEDIILSKYEYIREGEITKKTIEELVLDGVATGLVHKLDDIKRLQFKINRVASMINNLRHKYIVLNQERWRVKLVKISRIYHKQIKKITDNYTNKDILELEELKINNII